MSTTVTLSADQAEIRSVARRLLEARYPSERLRALAGKDDGWDPETWGEVVELGWPAIAIAEDQGGAGYGMAERALLLEEMGRVVAPIPYLSSAVLAADALAAVGSPDADDLLARIAAGEVRASLVAAGDLNARRDTAGDVTESGGSLNGSGGIVLEAAAADVLVVAAASADGSVGLFAVDGDAHGVERAPCDLIDETRRWATVSFANARARRLDTGGGVEEDLVHALARSSIALAAEMVGGAERCLQMTIEYAKDRQQFGVPIGSFQAIKHRLADLSVLVEAARESVYLGADALDSGEMDQLPACASAAKSAASDAAVKAAAETIQPHGGIGFTWEHDAHLYYKRALVDARMLGDAADHRERLGAHLTS
jgi:alkylation response protein AidB-like acyl-CoA dehydrogenase